MSGTQSDKDGADRPSATSSLMGLFEPPSSVSSEGNEGGKKNDNRSNSSNNSSSSSSSGRNNVTNGNREKNKEAAPIPAPAAAPLVDMFNPPPEAVSPTAAAAASPAVTNERKIVTDTTTSQMKLPQPTHTAVDLEPVTPTGNKKTLNSNSRLVGTDTVQAGGGNGADSFRALLASSAAENLSPTKFFPSADSPNYDTMVRNNKSTYTFPRHLPGPPLSRTLERESTERHANFTDERTSLLEQQPLKARSSLENLFAPPPAATISSPKTTQTSTTSSKGSSSRNGTSSQTVRRMPSISESSSLSERWWTPVGRFAQKQQYLCKASTFIGSFMFLLYHTVFILACGSTIIRPHSDVPILGLMAKLGAAGVIFSSPVYILNLGSDIPAMYPTVDLFLAPFLAQIAASVDSVLYRDNGPAATDNDGDTVFIATFAFLTSLGMALSAALIVLASTFKLANLGSFLPFPVLCGFFSAVGVLMWSLAFGVDTGGMGIGEVLGSGDTSVILNAMLHHLPSLVAGIIMKYLGTKNPVYSTFVLAGTVALFYLVMFLSGTSLEEARNHGWFWTHDDLVYSGETTTLGFQEWAPPAPLGVIVTTITGKVHWGAVKESLSTIVALSFLYLLRCSLHSTALKKNVTNLFRYDVVGTGDDGGHLGSKNPKRVPDQHRRRFTEELDVEAIVNLSTRGKDEPSVRSKGGKQTVVRPPNPTVPLRKMLMQYGYNQFICSAVGGFGVAPAIAASQTMYSLGADGVAPQFGSLILLFLFYLTDFKIVLFIPKASFSSLIILSFLDQVITWFFNSYGKIKEKSEWFVVPIIVLAANFVGLLSSVFLGIALSTFIFVASFFRSGVVKFLSNGLILRSTIQRHFDAMQWLDENGDMVQILILQNYLFFGNASSILTYIESMFEEPDEEPDFELPPLPRFIIIDLTLVTGMDTSTVDVFRDIKTLCAAHECKLFLSGLPASLRQTLIMGGFSVDTSLERSKRTVRYFMDLDSAIGKAEDILVDDEMSVAKDDKPTKADLGRKQSDENSLYRALLAFDEQHGKRFASELVGLHAYTTVVELDVGQSLYSCQGGPIADCERGLFFIEEGIIKIERDASVTLTRTVSNSHSTFSPTRSLNGLRARMGTLGKESAAWKAGGRQTHPLSSSSIRLARVGPGWVVGTLEGVLGGTELGLQQVAVTRCRLHHLPFVVMERMEEEDPRLMLQLYKLLGQLTATRQEIAIAQLSQLTTIMASPAQRKPLGRVGSRTALHEMSM